MREFIWHMTLTTVGTILIFICDVHELTMLNKILIALFVVIQLLGGMVQRFQVLLWMSREYLYLEAFVDPLTMLLNRRGANLQLKELLQKGSKSKNAGIIMFDIDYFKKYNDTYGHDAGDICLKTVGTVIRETLGNRTKLMIRHGGEEFVAILLDTNREELEEWAENIRTAVFEKRMEAPIKDVSDYVTVSVGASMEELPRENICYEQLLSNADKALYESKRMGRNRSVVV